MTESRSEASEVSGIPRLKLNLSSADINLERVLLSVIPDVVPSATFVLSGSCNTPWRANATENSGKHLHKN